MVGKGLKILYRGKLAYFEQLVDSLKKTCVNSERVNEKLLHQDFSLFAYFYSTIPSKTSKCIHETAWFIQSEFT